MDSYISLKPWLAQTFQAAVTLNSLLIFSLCASMCKQQIILTRYLVYKPWMRESICTAHRKHLKEDFLPWPLPFWHFRTASESSRDILKRLQYVRSSVGRPAAETARFNFDALQVLHNHYLMKHDKRELTVMCRKPINYHDWGHSKPQWLILGMQGTLNMDGYQNDDMHND